MTIATITPADVRHLLITRAELALLDLREEAPFADGHPLFAAQLSAGRIESEIFRRVPRRDTRIILYDNGEHLTEAAAHRLAALGYTNVAILTGGLAGWRDAGYELFQDVNSYSKAFGELVEHRRHTPSLSAPDVQALIASNADIRVMDARRFDEYRTMSIPSGISVPGAELVLRAPDLTPDPATTIIVNCAGRTRSIIGTQSLINAGLPNPVFALRNGTIGWTLAGQDLESSQTRKAPATNADTLALARVRARQVAYRAGVRHLTPGEAAALADDKQRTLYRFDVRDAEEYRAGHIPGFLHAPGGQLVQEADMFAPVRGARILLADDLGPRADMTASWLAQLGWDVYVVDGGFDGPLERGDPAPLVPPLPAVPFLSPDLLAARLAKGNVLLIDLAPSRAYQTGHIPGARFALRADLPDLLARNAGRDIVLTSPDGVLAAFAAADLPQGAATVIEGGTTGWARAGHPLVGGFDAPLSPPIDRYKRPYEGTDNAAEAMQAYLDWEYGLVAQLERDGTHGFFVI